MLLSKLFKRSKSSSENATLASAVAAQEAALAARPRAEEPVAPAPPPPPPPAEEIRVYVQATPNPNAHKFIMSKDVKTSGDATYRDPDAGDNELARALFGVPGVEQIYFFDNVVTLTLNPTVLLADVKDRVVALLKEKMPAHDPNFKTAEEIAKKPDYADLPEDLRRINEILDRTVRPGLQGDGGNIEILSYTDNQLSVRYQGACGSCPSSTMGTLQAITQILRDEFDPDIEVVPV